MCKCVRVWSRGVQKTILLAVVRKAAVFFRKKIFFWVQSTWYSRNPFQASSTKNGWTLQGSKVRRTADANVSGQNIHVICGQTPRVPRASYAVSKLELSSDCGTFCSSHLGASKFKHHPVPLLAAQLTPFEPTLYKSWSCWPKVSRSVHLALYLQDRGHSAQNRLLHVPDRDQHRVDCRFAQQAAGESPEAAKTAKGTQGLLCTMLLVVRVGDLTPCPLPRRALKMMCCPLNGKKHANAGALSDQIQANARLRIYPHRCRQFSDSKRKRSTR